MKILNVTAQKPDSTGSGTYLAELVRCQLAAGHQAAVVCGVGPDDEPRLAPGAQVRPVRFQTPGLPFPVCGMSDEMPYPATRYRDMTPEMVRRFEAAFAAVLDKAAGEFAPDIVICHHLYLLTAIVRERLAGAPMGAVCHSTDLRQMGTHGLARERITAAMRRLDAVFALHDGQKREIVEVYGVDPARVQVVGTGYNKDVFYAAARQAGVGEAACGTEPAVGGRPVPQDAGEAAAVDRVQLRPRPLELVYAGKIWGKKGVPNLLAALDRIDAGGREAVLRLAGGYNDQAEYERIRAQAAACRCQVEFLGKLSQPDLAEAYRRADIFVLPSFFEGLPLVVIEALACGCKVVMTDLPGIRPWLEERLPGAPVTYVEPPRMRRVDEPYAEDLPAFEGRLAAAIGKAARQPAAPCATEHLSWEHVSAAMVNTLQTR